MVCAYCGGKTRVVNSRHQVKSNRVWRRRRCLNCGAVFTSEEAVQYELTWVVLTKDGFQPFSRDKLFLSLLKCCEHRPDALGDAQALTDTILSKLPVPRSNTPGNTIRNDAIARVAMVTLNRFDQASAVRYRSLHRGT